MTMPAEPRVTLPQRDVNELLETCVQILEKNDVNEGACECDQGEGDHVIECLWHRLGRAVGQIHPRLETAVPIEWDRRGPGSKKHRAALSLLESSRGPAQPQAFEMAWAILRADREWLFTSPFFGMLERERGFVTKQLLAARRLSARHRAMDARNREIYAAGEGARS